uniref:Uncharacterized protein n=1 Tax=Cucumis melo TaxID=3656 RepID=A0A9I9CCF4_CUCME
MRSNPCKSFIHQTWRFRSSFNFQISLQDRDRRGLNW